MTVNRGQAPHVKRHNTAIKRTAHSVPYKEHIRAGRLDGKTVLDYGCGKGYDVTECRAKGYDVKGYDAYATGWYKLPAGVFDVVTCNYVLNVIESPAERAEVVAHIKSLGDTAYITVRADVDAIRDSWQKYQDGYYTKGKTFQKIYTKESLVKEFGAVEILTANSKYIMFKV